MSDKVRVKIIGGYEVEVSPAMAKVMSDTDGIKQWLDSMSHHRRRRGDTIRLALCEKRPKP